MFSQSILPIALVVIAGALLSTQAAVNARFAAELNSALLASTISFGVGFVAMLLVYFVHSQLAANWVEPSLRTVTPSLWLGGLLGAVYVTTVIFAVPKIGVASTIVLVIFGQLVVSLLLDHYAWLGVPFRAWDLSRTLGVALVVIGAVLVFKPKI